MSWISQIRTQVRCTKNSHKVRVPFCQVCLRRVDKGGKDSRDRTALVGHAEPLVIHVVTFTLHFLVQFPWSHDILLLYGLVYRHDLERSWSSLDLVMDQNTTCFCDLIKNVSLELALLSFNDSVFHSLGLDIGDWLIRQTQDIRDASNI